MPAGFDKCSNNGGRVRTKTLGDGKYMHICYLNGKSYAGDVKTKKEESELPDLEHEYIKKDGKWIMADIESKQFCIQTPILESKIDEAKMTVEACVLAPCVSLNGRYYSPQVVESAVKQLAGLKSFADHYDRSVKNTIAKITEARIDNGRAIATFKFSKARDIAESVFTRIKEGIITDVSIAASGNTKRVKLNGESVDEVLDIKLHSVDFVSEGGVPEARVLQVFESNNLPKIEDVVENTVETKVEEKEVSKSMTIEELKQLHPELVAEIEKPFAETKTVLETTQKELEELKMQIKTKELAELKARIVSEVKESDKLRSYIAERVTGNTEEELRQSLTKVLAELQSIKEAIVPITGLPAVTVEKDGKKKKYTSSSEILNDGSLTESEKASFIQELWWGKR